MNDRNTNELNKDRDRPEIGETGEDALKTEERSLDVGESGQFAPGGYYNQQGLNDPERSALDED